MREKIVIIFFELLVLKYNEQNKSFCHAADFLHEIVIKDDMLTLI